jgi:FAD synthase
MEKILLKGPRISMENKNPDIQEIKTLSESALGSGKEYFINAHGGEELSLWEGIKSYFTPVPSFLSLDLFAEDESETDILDIILLNKIQNNTAENQCNIVHIFSCHSGAAQHHLNDINGNIVLCTYSKAGDVSIVQLGQNNYDARIKNDSSLVEYIRDNFHLLAASDFSISYKLYNQIHNFSLSADKIKNMQSIEELPVFLHKEYEKFVKFYKNIHSKYHDSYPEIFDSNIEAKPKGLAYSDLIRVFNRALTLEVYNFNKFSLSKIETMLNQKRLNTDLSINKAIEKGNLELLTYLLNYDNTKISSSNIYKAIEKGDLVILKAVLEHSTIKIDSFNLGKAIEKGDLVILKPILEHSTTKIDSSNLNDAIEKGDLAILKAVLEHSTTKIDSFNLGKAIEKGDLAILKAVLEHSTTKIDSFNLGKAIEKGDLDILKAVLDHNTAKIESWILDKAIEKGDLAILKAVLEHSTTKIESYSLGKVIEKGDLDILDMVLKHPTIEVNSYNIYTAEETHNLDVIELVKKYYNSTINTITPEETIIDTTFTVVEEVLVLGEGIEAV